VWFSSPHPSSFCAQVVGVVVTASHNPVQDNGVKIVDPDGGMLAASVGLSFFVPMRNYDDMTTHAHHPTLFFWGKSNIQGTV
jgi:phosphomannomutase